MQLYDCAPRRFAGTDNYDRHLVFDHAVTLENRQPVGASLERCPIYCHNLGNHRADLPKQQCQAVYYLSTKFLLGRTLVNKIVKRGVEQFVEDERKLRFR